LPVPELFQSWHDREKLLQNENYTYYYRFGKINDYDKHNHQSPFRKKNAYAARKTITRPPMARNTVTSGGIRTPTNPGFRRPARAGNVPYPGLFM
jgi:hypothetical protein